MKPITRKVTSTFVMLMAVAGAGTLYAQADKPADGGGMMMHGGPGAMGHGDSGDRMNMMQMMAQMSQMMESCNKMMKSMAPKDRKEFQSSDRKEQ